MFIITAKSPSDTNYYYSSWSAKKTAREIPPTPFKTLSVSRFTYSFFESGQHFETFRTHTELCTTYAQSVNYVRRNFDVLILFYQHAVTGFGLLDAGIVF